MAAFPPSLPVGLHQCGGTFESTGIGHAHDVVAVLGGIDERFLRRDRCDPNGRVRLLKWPRHGMYALEPPESALVRHALLGPQPFDHRDALVEPRSAVL